MNLRVLGVLALAATSPAASAAPCDAAMFARADPSGKLGSRPPSSCESFSTETTWFAVLSFEGPGEHAEAIFAWAALSGEEGGMDTLHLPNLSGEFRRPRVRRLPYPVPVVEVVVGRSGDIEGHAEERSYWTLTPRGPVPIHDEGVLLDDGNGGYPQLRETLTVSDSPSVSGPAPDLSFHRTRTREEPDVEPVTTEEETWFCYQGSSWERSEAPGCPVTRSATASSTLRPGETTRYDAELAIDDEWDTAWVEGVPGPGIGQTLRVTLDRPVELASLAVTPGYAKPEAWEANNRVKSAVITLSDGTRIEAAFGDTFGSQVIPLGRTPLVEWVELEIRAVYRGEKFDDTCVSELTLSW